MNDPSTSLTVTAGSDGSPVVNSQDTLPVTYTMTYWNGNSPESSNTNWTNSPMPPPGVQINPGTGVISAYNTNEGEPNIGSDVHGNNPPNSMTVTYTVRVTGTDAAGAAGVEQFQLTVINNGSVSPATTTVSYDGNDSDNANAELTIGLNSNGTAADTQRRTTSATPTRVMARESTSRLSDRPAGTSAA